MISEVIFGATALAACLGASALSLQMAYWHLREREWIPAALLSLPIVFIVAFGLSTVGL